MKKLLTLLVACAIFVPAVIGIPIRTNTAMASNALLGDVDGNGHIDSSDASMVLKEYAGNSTGSGNSLSSARKSLANVNYDSNIDSSDASTILRYYSYTSTGGTLSLPKFLISQPVFDSSATTASPSAPSTPSTPSTPSAPSTPSSGSSSSQRDYVLNNNTMKFHLPGCSQAKRIKDENRQDYRGTRDRLIANGYSPCKICHP